MKSCFDIRTIYNCRRKRKASAGEYRVASEVIKTALALRQIAKKKEHCSPLSLALSHVYIHSDKATVVSVFAARALEP